MRKAYIFPGQGSQFSGMGVELYKTNSTAHEMFEIANEILGFRITDIMFSGTPEELKQTQVTQPAIFLHSVILAECYQGLSDTILAEKGLERYEPTMVAGHSLGEFAALTVAKAISFEDALKLVYIRANEMQKCCEKISGSMAAVIGLDDKVIEQICASCDSLVVPANYNCYGQVVISGEKMAVEQACSLAKKVGAKIHVLQVSGAFHSPLMQPAADQLERKMQDTKILHPICPIYQNFSAMPETEPERIKTNLLKQLTHPVLWKSSVKNMMQNGADYFMEIGPGNVLQGLVKRISLEHLAGQSKIEVKGIISL